MDTSDSVAEAYDQIVNAWRESRAGANAVFSERRFVEQFVARLPPKARILDAGCGCGEPLAHFLSTAGFEVVGIDASARLLDLARRAVPSARFIHGDMRTVDPGGRFDGIVAWDSIFHVPRGDHPALFARFWAWLRPSGSLLLSLGGSGAASFTSEMHGATFFYGAQEPAEARRLRGGRVKTNRRATGQIAFVRPRVLW
jgi:2-polyprenyl-3-methyl-5-hydroxy-6-metoxy-1,4-benzoquinol methylase